MQIYVILIEDGKEGAKKVIEEKWKDIRHKRMSDNIFLVAESEPTLAANIRDRIGIAVDSEVTGIVIEMKAWAGAVSTELVEWVRKVREL